ncbi:MAG: glycosyltransferase [Caldilineaceae bacterium]|nr:glycosyltransferase [Caldilineaceae bacterium]
MRILHVIPSVAEVRGGPSRAALEMVAALRNGAIDAEIIATNDNGPDLLQVPPAKRILYQGVPVTFFPRFSPAFGPVREYALSQQLTMWLWQHMGDYDIVHVHALFSYASTVAMLLARYKRVPYLTTPHGLLCEWSLQQQARKKQAYWKLLDRANLNAAQAIHFTDVKEAEEAAALRLAPPGFVLPLGLEMPQPLSDARARLRQYLKLPPDEPVILFMSRIHPKKGLDYLIPALGKLAEERFTFVLAGSGPDDYVQHIQQLITTAGLGSRIRYPGFVRDELKALLLQGADLFVLTSHSENFGIVILEAMAAGIPVLVTPGVPLAPTVAAGGFGYVCQLDQREIAASIWQCLQHRAEGQEMGERARRYVLDHFAWDRIATELADVYEAILKHEALPRLQAGALSVDRTMISHHSSP